MDVSVDLHDGVALITMDDGKKNAITPEALVEKVQSLDLPAVEQRAEQAKLRVLVVDDSSVVRRLVGRALAREEGLEVDIKSTSRISKSWTCSPGARSCWRFSADSVHWPCFTSSAPSPPTSS